MAGGSSKKKSSADDSHRYSPDDIVLVSLKGYPTWPAIVVDPTNVPKAVISTKPASRTYVVRYVPSAEYMFANSRDLKLFSKDGATAALEKFKGSRDLKVAYEIIVDDPHAWNDKQNEIVKASEQAIADGLAAAAEDMDELEDDASAQPAAAKKKKATSAANNKRKRASDAAADKKGAAKSSKKKKTDTAASKAKPDAAADDLSDGEKKVKDWRHKIQRIFLGNKDAQADDMPGMDETFREVEAFTEMNADHLRSSKIGKVMKRVKGLEDAKVPRDDEFKFRERAGKLCDTWATIVAPESSVGDDTVMTVVPDADASMAEPAASGEAPSDAAALPSSESSAPNANGTAPTQDTPAEAAQPAA